MVGACGQVLSKVHDLPFLLDDRSHAIVDTEAHPKTTLSSHISQLGSVCDSSHRQYLSTHTHTHTDTHSHAPMQAYTLADPHTDTHCTKLFKHSSAGAPSGLSRTNNAYIRYTHNNEYFCLNRTALSHRDQAGY